MMADATVELSDEKLKICSMCDKKTFDWKCDYSKESLFSLSKDPNAVCPLNRWGKSLFPTSEEAKMELIQLGHNGSVLDKIGAVNIENFGRGALSAQFKKKNLQLKPNKNLITPKSSIEDIIYCIKNYPPGGWLNDFYKWDNVQEAFRRLCGEITPNIVANEYPKDRFKGRGIIVCGGGPKYYPSVYVNLRILRLLGCKLPVEVYYIGCKEMDPQMIHILESIEDVKCIDAVALETKYPIRIHGGWESKVYSIINCSFEEVLMMDADNTALVDPEYIFDTKQYQETGAVLWPDYECWKHDKNMWKILGLDYRNELQVESGQVLVNKSKCWKEINMAKYYCDYSDYYFKLFYGDKETFHFGWRFFDSDYGFPPGPDWINNSIIVQKDFTGAWLFSHRAQAKFKLNKSHKITMEMPHEQDTLDLLDELKEMWGGAVWVNATPSEWEKQIINELVNKRYRYERVGLDYRDIELLADNKLGYGSDRLERHWYIFLTKMGLKMSIHGDTGLTAILDWSNERKCWEGQWLDHERCKIVIEEIK